MSAGYSGTPLGKKLGYCDFAAVLEVNMPDSVKKDIEAYAPVAWVSKKSTDRLAAAHGFFNRRTDLEAFVGAMRKSVLDTGMVWISWPKKAAKMETDITEDVVRDVALPTGFVDVKVCAVDAIWSGLKLMVRKELRAG